MRLIDTSLEDAKLIELNIQSDSRGTFTRLFCVQELSFFSAKQANLSTNIKKGTLRGLHFQKHPHAEAKIVHCLAGEVFDVIVDLRKKSPTFKQHFSTILSSKCALYVPPGFAHGFMTLQPHSQLLYFMSEFYNPNSYQGVAWNDPELNISWPLEVTEMSIKDQQLPFLEALDAM